MKTVSSSFSELESPMENESEKYVSVDGMNIRYAVRGSGPPLLLLHGFCEFLETWDLNLGPLGEHRRVYAMDLPGHGLSDKPYLDYTISFFTDFILSFMRTLRINGTDIIGHSFGGAIGINLAANYPDKIHRLVLESSFGLSNDISLLHRLCRAPVLTEAEGRSEQEKASLEERVKMEFYQPDFVAYELVRRSYKFGQMPEARRVMLNTMHNWVEADGLRPEAVMTDQLTRLKAPTLLIHCEQDKIHPPELSQNAARLIKNSKLMICRKCGHCPHLEKAREFNEVVTSFLISKN